VPSRTLDGLQPGAAVDLFVRPEALRVIEDGGPVAAHGTVAAQVYQGGHIELHVNVEEAAPGRMLLRLPGNVETTRWATGTRVAIGLAESEGIAFPPAAKA
jgi:hypothetical protein